MEKLHSVLFESLNTTNWFDKKLTYFQRYNPHITIGYRDLENMFKDADFVEELQGHNVDFGKSVLGEFKQQEGLDLLASFWYASVGSRTGDNSISIVKGTEAFKKYLNEIQEGYPKKIPYEKINKTRKYNVVTQSMVDQDVSVEDKIKDKNKINDQTINGFKVRFQNIIDLPFKDLRKLIDEGKKEIGEGLVIIYAINDNKVGLAVGVTKTLEDKFDAVKIVRAGSEVIGGKGGGGRVDFAQAGGTLPEKIQESFESIKELIN